MVVGATAVVVDALGVALVADERGNIWEVEVEVGRGAEMGGMVAVRHMAQLPGSTITRMAVPPTALSTADGATGDVGSSSNTVAVSTLGGLLTIYRYAFQCIHCIRCCGCMLLPLC
jgi:hypothetical protein